MIVWVFVLLLHLPSFGGPVTITIEAADAESCARLRRVAIGQLGGVKNIQGEVTPCAPKAKRPATQDGDEQS